MKFKAERKVAMEEMSNAQFNAFLETLAKLIESKAKSVEEATELIREAKVK